ncbi:MAG: hypothetical protein TREMPRED_004360 [Tremellales sp. Tagirdzhanova-0007]|nr:MAG: hypothetical protein TREMPRED_004360 [Tremellales sp. Tagirdzhanova-0007]
MSDHQQILDEELEVSASIFSDEYERLSERYVRIRVDAEDSPSTSLSTTKRLSVYLCFTYPLTYPDEIPELEFQSVDEESGLEDGEVEVVLRDLRITAEDSIGMAMTFTIASAARECLGEVVRGRLKKEKEEDDQRSRDYEEAEAKRTRGTPLTPATFDKWRKSFLSDLNVKRDKEENERIKALPPKEREEYRRRRERLSGKQLFESSQTLATSDEALYEEGTGEVDLTQYSREEREEARRREEEEEERTRKGLVDTGEESDRD